MAIPLKDLIASQARLSEKEKMAASKERMSMAEFRQITAAGGSDVMANELKKHTGLLKIIADKKETTKKGPDDTAKAEVDQEARSVEEGKVKLLSKIEENTRKDKEKKKDEEKAKDEGSNLPLVIAGIAASLGALSGVLKAYVKTVKTFAEALTPKFIKNKIGTALENTVKFFEEISTTIKGAFKSKFEKVVKIVASIISGISMQFDVLKSSVMPIIEEISAAFKNSKIGKTLLSIVQYFSGAVKTLVAPFTEAYAAIKELGTGPVGKIVGYIKNISSVIMKPFAELMKGVSSIGTMFSKAAGFIAKLATPLMIIMTVWDTVKGALEGFEKDGIIGAISGAIKGFVNSLVTGPADLLKDIASWVLKQFGFEEASKFLDSINITQGFNDMVDYIANFVKGVISWFEAIEIPKIEFTIPLINKDVSIGPFAPFKSNKSETAKVQDKTSAPTSSSRATAESAAISTPLKDKATGSGISQDISITPAGNARQQYYKEMGFSPEQVKTLEDRRSKIDAVRSQDPNNEIDAELGMYNERGAKADAQLAAAGVKPMTISPMTAGMVYDQSAQNAGMSQVQPAAPNVVVAPTSVTNNKTQLPQMRFQQRNTDSTFSRLSERMFAPI